MRHRCCLIPLLIVLAVLAVGCAAREPQTGPAAEVASESAPETTDAATSSPPADCDFSDHAEGVLDSVFQVVTDDGIGTAFYLGDREWLTAAHVVGTASSIALSNGPSDVSASVKGIDYNADLALLEGVPAGGKAVQPLRIEEATPQPGDAAIVVGYPLYQEDSASVSRGVVSRLEDDDFGELIVSDASVNPGNSGGPMLNECGNVIGVVFQKYVGFDVEGIGYAISANDVTSVLPRLRDGFKGTPGPTTTLGDSSTPSGTTLPPAPAIWTVTETEPDLLTGETFPIAFITASDYERDFDLYDPPVLGISCDGTWGLWWGGGYVAAPYGGGIPAAYRVGDGQVFALEWNEYSDNESMSLSGADAEQLGESVLQASPTEEIIIRAWNYDDSEIGTAVFSLDGLSEAVLKMKRRCVPLFAQTVTDEVISGSFASGQWVRWVSEPVNGMFIPGTRGMAMAVVCVGESDNGVLFMHSIPLATQEEYQLWYWLGSSFDKGNQTLAQVDRDDNLLFMQWYDENSFIRALDADTTGTLQVEVKNLDGSETVGGAAEFDISRWPEAKAALQAECLTRWHRKDL